jgi:hypothetical protein
MITIPDGFQEPVIIEFRYLVDFFNKLEKRLEYPNCEGYSDTRRYILLAQKELIERGFIH